MKVGGIVGERYFCHLVTALTSYMKSAAESVTMKWRVEMDGEDIGVVYSTHAFWLYWFGFSAALCRFGREVGIMSVLCRFG